LHRCALEGFDLMSSLPADDRIAPVNDDAGRSASRSRLKGSLAGITFALLAGVAMAGWLYLIGKALWACIGWLLF
jgi:hypothetical protein